MRSFRFRSSLKKWPAPPLVSSALGLRNEAPRRTREKTSGTQGNPSTVFFKFWKRPVREYPWTLLETGPWNQLTRERLHSSTTSWNFTNACVVRDTNFTLCKMFWLWGAVHVSLLAFNKSFLNLATLLILGRSFQWYWRIFANWSQ